MAEQRTQSFASHAAIHPIWHYGAFPILAINFFNELRHVYQAPSTHTVWGAIFAFGLLLSLFAARGETLVVQNRVIRLEMRLRLRDLLSPELATRIPELTTGQLIGLRFASDAELPALVERCLKGELPNGKACKQAVTNWQADFLRA